MAQATRSRWRATEFALSDIYPVPAEVEPMRALPKVGAEIVVKHMSTTVLRGVQTAVRYPVPTAVPGMDGALVGLTAITIIARSRLDVSDMLLTRAGERLAETLFSCARASTEPHGQLYLARVELGAPLPLAADDVCTLAIAVEAPPPLVALEYVNDPADGAPIRSSRAGELSLSRTSALVTDSGPALLKSVVLRTTAPHAQTITVDLIEMLPGNETRTTQLAGTVVAARTFGGDAYEVPLPPVFVDGVWRLNATVGGCTLTSVVAHFARVLSDPEAPAPEPEAPAAEPEAPPVSLDDVQRMMAAHVSTRDKSFEQRLHLLQIVIAVMVVLHAALAAANLSR